MDKYDDEISMLDKLKEIKDAISSLRVISQRAGRIEEFIIRKLMDIEAEIIHQKIEEMMNKR